MCVFNFRLGNSGSGWFSWLLPGSAVRICTKLPISTSGYHTFQSCTHADCLAYKGIEYARLQDPNSGLSVGVYGTHLQAWDDDGATTARAGQINEMAEFMQEGRDNEDVQILAGDLNINNCPKDGDQQLVRESSSDSNGT